MTKNVLITAVCLFILSCITVTAQELKVKSFECLDRDLLARTKERLDLNENPCAILRISVPNSDDFVFEGNIIGKPEYTPGEILIWLTNGTKNITIKSEKTGSLKFDFPQKLESRVVYKLTLYTPNLQVFRLDFTPTDAKIYINDELQTALNGSFASDLDKGKYRYRIEHKYYHTEEGEFEIKDGEATILTKSLKPNFGIVQVTSKRNANITINNHTYKKTKTASDTLLTGTYPIIARHNQIKEKIMVQVGEGKTEKINIKYRPDIFVLGTYSIIRNMYGATLGIGKNYGGYLSARFGEANLGSYKESGEEVGTSKDFGGGFLFKITNWLYLQGGLGYSQIEFNERDYENVVDKGMYFDGGFIFRIGNRLLLSGLCTPRISFGELETICEPTIGLGIAF